MALYLTVKSGKAITSILCRFAAGRMEGIGAEGYLPAENGHKNRPDFDALGSQGGDQNLPPPANQTMEGFFDHQPGLWRIQTKAQGKIGAKSWRNHKWAGNAFAHVVSRALPWRSVTRKGKKSVTLMFVQGAANWKNFQIVQEKHI